MLGADPKSVETRHQTQYQRLKQDPIKYAKYLEASRKRGLIRNGKRTKGDMSPEAYADSVAKAKIRLQKQRKAVLAQTGKTLHQRRMLRWKLNHPEKLINYRKKAKSRHAARTSRIRRDWEAMTPEQRATHLASTPVKRRRLVPKTKDELQIIFAHRTVVQREKRAVSTVEALRRGECVKRTKSNRLRVRVEELLQLEPTLLELYCSQKKRVWASTPDGLKSKKRFREREAAHKAADPNYLTSSDRWKALNRERISAYHKKYNTRNRSNLNAANERYRAKLRVENLSCGVARLSALATTDAPVRAQIKPRPVLTEGQLDARRERNRLSHRRAVEKYGREAIMLQQRKWRAEHPELLTKYQAKQREKQRAKQRAKQQAKR